MFTKYYNINRIFCRASDKFENSVSRLSTGMQSGLLPDNNELLAAPNALCHLKRLVNLSRGVHNMSEVKEALQEL